jgi:Flp pilus assembly protein TadG
MKALSGRDRTARITRHAMSLWLSDRRGGVAVIFAASIFPVILLGGAAIDLGFITQATAQLNAAADSAALAAATTAANAFTSQQQNYLTLGKNAGNQFFTAQATTVMDTIAPAASVVVTQSGSSFNATVTYTAAVSTYFAWLFGVVTVPVSGLSSSTISANAYVAVTFLLDNSSSMLIASTQAGVNFLNSVTPVGSSTPNKPAGLSQATLNAVPGANGLGGLQCAFACHWDANNNDYYGLARANNVQLRFDVVQSALASAINEMVTLQAIPNQFAVGIYTFNNTLTKIYPSSPNQTTSTDLSDGITAAQAMSSPVVPDAANTNFPAIMASLASASTAAGDGSSPTSPKKALIIVTDGLADYGSRSIPTTEGPLNPANCTAMKNLGYNVYVLYTTYITTPSNLVLPFSNINLLAYLNVTQSPTMAGSLQSCASAPGNYVQASNPADITTAMTQLLQAALANGGRLTN